MLQPLLVAERPQTDIEKPFQLSSEFKPAGDQPQAIDELCEGLTRGERDQVLLGVTGSGKTFTMAHVIQHQQRPAIVLAPNKTLAAQLYGEMKSFFPDNAVEYFVSSYDYYQPEAVVSPASVSCIYVIVSVKTYSTMTVTLEAAKTISRTKLLAQLVELQYK